MSQHVSAATHVCQLQIIQHFALNRLLNIVLGQVYDVILRDTGLNLTAPHLFKVIFILISNNLATCEASYGTDHLSYKVVGEKYV